MNRRGSRIFIIGAGFFLAEVASRSQTYSIIVPKRAANAFGATIGFFFNSYGFAQMYGASEFSDLPGEVIAISQIELPVPAGTVAHVESAASVSGTYATENEAKVTDLAAGKKRAQIQSLSGGASSDFERSNQYELHRRDLAELVRK